jgi:hypothetical protein
MLHLAKRYVYCIPSAVASGDFMIRFIDLGTQITCDPEGDRHFAFYDTITDGFIKVNDECIWTAWIDFEEDVMKMFRDPVVHFEFLKRLRPLCPQWVFE